MRVIAAIFLAFIAGLAFVDARAEIVGRATVRLLRGQNNAPPREHAAKTQEVECGWWSREGKAKQGKAHETL